MSNDYHSQSPSSLRSKLIETGLRLLAQDARYGEVVGLYEKGQIAAGGGVSETVGYCYYQLSKFEKAIPFLQEAIQISPAHYHPRYWLALSFKALNRRSEAIDQLLACLTLNVPQTDQILDTLLPLAAEDFSKIADTLEGLALSNLNRAKVLFYQHRDNEIATEILEGVRLCHFYSARDLADMGHGRYLSLCEPEKLRFVRFEDNSDIWIDTPAPYVAEIPDATVMYNSSVILVGENKILSDLLSNVDYGHFVDMLYDSNVIAHRNDALLIKQPKPEVEIPEGIMLSGLASSAYGHWFAEFLPKLRFYEMHPRFSQLPIIVDDEMPQSHYDFLSTLVSNPVHRVVKGGSLKIKNLLVAPTDTFFPTELVKSHSVPPEQQASLTIGALKYISTKIAKHFGSPRHPTSRIFLSRQNSQWRKPINEKEIADVLREFSFKTVCIENLPFEEQVKVFQAAAFIVAPNGSALNNLIFSNPKTKVLILGQKNLFNWGGWFGSFMELGYSMVYMAGDAVGDEKEKHSNYLIPAALVRAKVLEMLDFKILDAFASPLN